MRSLFLLVGLLLFSACTLTIPVDENVMCDGIERGVVTTSEIEGRDADDFTIDDVCKISEEMLSIQCGFDVDCVPDGNKCDCFQGGTA